MRKPRRKAPKYCQWRGNVLWARFWVDGKEFRASLFTGDAELAGRRAKEWRDREVAIRKFGDDRKPWTDAFVAWSAHIVGQVGPNTAKRYAVSLGQLERWLKPLFIDQIDRAVVLRIVDERRAAGVSQATIRRDLTALSSVLAYAEDRQWREGNPALDRLRRLKERRDPIVLPDPADIERVIATCPGNLAHMVRAALLTGCRQDELVTARRRNLDHKLKQLTVIGKGNKLRVIDLSPEAYETLRRVPASLGKTDAFLFWHGDGEPYRNVASRFAHLVRSAHKSAQAAGQDFRPFRFHDLRHWFAVDFLKRGGRLYDLQGHLGHGSIKTTEIYLRHLTPEEARRAKEGTGQKPAQQQAVSPRAGIAEIEHGSGG